MGLNLKLSEYHAAIGLASVQNSERFAKSYNNQYKTYVQLFTNYLQGQNVSIFTDERPKTTFNIRNSTSTENSKITYECLTEHGFELRKWWGLPISMTPISKYCEIVGTMKNSTLLSEEVIGLPIGDHIDNQAQVHIAKSIAGILLDS